MSEKEQKKYFFDKPENVKWTMRVLYITSTLLVVADFIIHRHIGLPWEKIPAFYAIYGFVACVALVVIAKEIRKIVMRKENYYDE
ncbi:hypothetical protein MNBD_GAMMA13-567 [hydrothermal vent metagenome]|uniref:2TM domain-containing protein n=1 Tax=hydrothermal vent metagenome TaxID=652676 RepID=A0A3B0YTJ9_9ZZZZ